MNKINWKEFGEDLIELCKKHEAYVGQTVQVCAVVFLVEEESRGETHLLTTYGDHDNMTASCAGAGVDFLNEKYGK